MELDTPYIHLRIQDNILVGTYKKNVSINLAIARQIVLDRLSFTEGKMYPSLIMSEGIISMDKPAREYLSSEQGTAGLVAAAIIANSPFSWMLGNFFMKVNKTSMPVKIFTKIPRAIGWLKTFID
ncbi:MAG: hypothetical protein JWP81_1079 [Ferruginibacter sp.]|nr:hypothetical protein [Ferruginibacter sp.]